MIDSFWRSHISENGLIQLWWKFLSEYPIFQETYHYSEYALAFGRAALLVRTQEQAHRDPEEAALCGLVRLEGLVHYQGIWDEFGPELYDELENWLCDRLESEWQDRIAAYERDEMEEYLNRGYV